jgi:aryl-alcohol dehydrogenase-like predicted oxidoreductase
MKVDRRIFIAALATGTAHLMFAPLFASGSLTNVDINPLQRIKLGKSGIETSLLGFGTGVNGGSRSSFLTRQDKMKSIATLVHGYNRGIRYYDLADTYGTHGLMKEALKEMDRNEVTLGSKIWTRGGAIPENERPDANIVVDRFRKELGTDYIDLVQIHCMEDGKWTDIEKEQMDILENLKAKGIIRAHGTSVHSLEAMQTAAATDWVDVLHARINPYGIAMDRKNPEEVITVLSKLHNSGKGIIGMKLVGNGEYKDNSEKINHSLKFVLGLTMVDMIIVGFENNNEIDNYLERMEKTLLELKAPKQ